VRGLKPSRAHSPSWKRSESAAAWPRVEISCPSTASGSQLVGLRVNSGRSRRTEAERMFSGMPSRISGSGSVTAVISAVVGSTCRATRTTTVPRSKGPETAGVTIAMLSGAPL